MGDPQPYDPDVRPLPRPEAVRDLVHRLARDSARIKWSRHALDRMAERSIIDQMAIDVLRSGSLRGDVVLGNNPGELQVKMVRQIAGHREVGVVVVAVKSQYLLVKTVEWEDLR